MLDIAIIGFGKMGRIRARAIESSGRGRVVAIYEPQMTSECPYPQAPDEEAIFSNPEVKAVFICTPNYRTPELIQRALLAGKHVFSEKPPALNAQQMEQIRCVEATSGNLKLMYGFNHRHHGSIQRMKAIVESGEMGRILWMRGRYGKEVDASYFETWRAKPELAGGGILLDQGIHMLDLFLYLCGGFDEVHAFVSNLFWKIEGIEDNVFAIFKNSETGVCASLHSTMTQWRYLFSLEVFLEGGALILNGLKTSSGAYGDETLAIKRNHPQGVGTYAAEEHLIYHTDTSWSSEIDHFFDCVEQDTPVSQGNSTDALKLMRLMDRIYQNGGQTPEC
jgi:1,5-anhydro-D-fructose reductase (1,5-anhydro-D-mannitol-forming)